MSSVVDYDINQTTSTNAKYHIMLIYSVDDDGYYEGGFYEPSTHGMGAVGGESLDKMLDEAYEALEESIQDEGHIPFDIKNIKKSVVFDLVECHTEDETLKALSLRRKVKNFEEINKAILQ